MSFRPASCAAVFLAFSVLASACGGSSQTLSPQDPAQTDSVLDGSSSTSPQTSVAASKDVAKYTLVAAAGDGSSILLEISFGALRRASEDRAASASSACSVDPERDAIVPVRIELSNTTSTFAIDVPAGFRQFLAQFPTGPITRVGLNGSQSASCTNPGLSDPLINVISRGTAAGGRNTILVSLVLRGVYSPRYPTGDSEALSGIVFRPDLYTNQSGDFGVRSISGPGVDKSDASFTLDGRPATAAKTIACGGHLLCS